MQVDVILDARASAAELATLGRLAEDAGIRGVWVSSLRDSRDPFANLVPLAQATSRITLGPIAVNPFDTHPLKLAASLLTLNELAGGRARIVVGGGGEVLDALDLLPRRRVRAVRECVEIMRAAASGMPIDYRGELFRVRETRFGWLTVPPLPIAIGAGERQMLRMAAQVGDGIMMSDVPPAPARATLATLDEALQAEGKARPAFTTNVFTAWHFCEEAREARAEARRWLYLRGIFRPWLLAHLLEPAEVEQVMARREAFAAAFFAGSPTVAGVPEPLLDRLVDELTLCATPTTLDAVIARLHEMRAAGLGAVALRLYARPAESIRMIGARVVGALC